MKVPTDLTTIFRAAAHTISRVGWAQGFDAVTGRRATDDGIDVVAALRLVITGNALDDTPYLEGLVYEAEYALADLLGLMRDPRACPMEALVDWNDDLLDRTVDDVLDALRRAAAVVGRPLVWDDVAKVARADCAESGGAA